LCKADDALTILCKVIYKILYTKPVVTGTLYTICLDKLSRALDTKQQAKKLKSLLNAMVPIDKSILKTVSKLKGNYMATARDLEYNLAILSQT
jgi:hypothetical protein